MLNKLCHLYLGKSFRLEMLSLCDWVLNNSLGPVLLVRCVYVKKSVPLLSTAADDCWTDWGQGRHSLLGHSAQYRRPGMRTLLPCSGQWRKKIDRLGSCTLEQEGRAGIWVSPYHHKRPLFTLTSNNQWQDHRALPHDTRAVRAQRLNLREYPGLLALSLPRNVPHLLCHLSPPSPPIPSLRPTFKVPSLIPHSTDTASKKAAKSPPWLCFQS